MNTEIESLFGELRDRGIRLVLRDGNLLLSDPQKRLTALLKSRLRERKAEIVAVLSQGKRAARRTRSFDENVSIPFQPLQRDLIEYCHADERIQHFTGSRCVELVTEKLSFVAFEQAVERICIWYPVLGTRIFRQDGILVQALRPCDPSTLIERHLRGPMSEAEVDETFESLCRDLPRSFRFTEDDSLLKFCWFQTENDPVARVLILWHHWLLDGYGSTLLFAELGRAISSAALGQVADEPGENASALDWNDRQIAEARDAGRGEAEYWLAQPWNAAPDIAPDAADFDPSCIYESETLEEADRRAMDRLWQGGQSAEDEDRFAALHGSALLSRERTAELMDLSASLGFNVLDLILLAVHRAVNRWSAAPTRPYYIYNNLRGPIFDDLDVSQTVGGTSAICPVFVEERTAILDTFRLMRDRRAQVPNQGATYASLKYDHPDPAIRAALMACAARQQIHVNYMPPPQGAIADYCEAFRAGHLRISEKQLSLENNHPRVQPTNRIYLGIMVQAGQLSCIPCMVGYDRPSRPFRNPHYHPVRAVALGRDTLRAIESILAALSPLAVVKA